MAAERSTLQINASSIVEGLDFRTKSIEDSIAPLIAQVTTLARHNETGSPVSEKKSYNPAKLARAVDKAVQQFVVAGQQIANDNPDFEQRILQACDAVSVSGAAMSNKAKIFVEDPTSSEKRKEMVFASRGLLMSVARLMIAADRIDVQNILRASYRIEELLKSLSRASNMEELTTSWGIFAPEVVSLMQLAAQRQKDIKDEEIRERMAVSRSEFDKSSKLFLTCAQTHIEHSSQTSAKENKEFVLGQMLKALKTICAVVDGETPVNLDPNEVIVVPPAEEGDLEKSLNSLESFIESCERCPPTPQGLEQMKSSLENVTRAAIFLKESHSSPQERSQSVVVSSCKAVAEGFKSLVDSFQGSRKTKDQKTQKQIVEEVKQKLSDLKRDLRRGMLDHVSDVFVDTSYPIIDLMENAEQGNLEKMEEKMTAYLRHAREIEKVTTFASSLSGDAQGVKLVKYVVHKMTVLAPQVVNAAETLSVDHNNKAAKENMAAFKDFWEETIEALTDAVDIIIPVTDFMAVSDVHIKKDIERCLKSVSDNNLANIDQSAGLVRGRCARLMRVVRADMEENPTRYAGGHEARIFSAFVRLREKVLPKFSDEADRAYDVLSTTHDPRLVDMVGLENAAGKVLESIASLQKRVLVTFSKEELDVESLRLVMSATKVSQEDTRKKDHSPSPQPSPAVCTPPVEKSAVFQRTQIPSKVAPSSETSAQQIMADLPESEQEKLAMASEVLQEQHAALQSEATRWEEVSSDNDCITLAREMCTMMLDMSDFTRGQGPLKTADDVIHTAQDIARAGDQLNNLTKKIADECPDASCKSDLLAYLDQVKLCCHQLRICSAVRADLRASVREKVESASALMTAAKNLMNAVVLTVKMCYIASKAIAKVKGSAPGTLLQWEMRTPRKKDLLGATYAGDNSPRQRPSMNRYDSTIAPMKELGEFRGKGVQSTCV